MDVMVALVELLLTTELYNKDLNFTVDDMPHHIRAHYWSAVDKTVPRPVYVTESDVKQIYGVDGIRESLATLPFVEFEEFGSLITLTVFDLAWRWFVKQPGARDVVGKNPVLASYFEKKGLLNASYEAAKKANLPKEASRAWIDSLLADVAGERDSDDMLKLVYISAPDEIEQSLSDLVLTEDQLEEVSKIGRAIEYREYLKRIGLTDIGKLLFVGPPGTGKTSMARAISRELHLPLIEVRLSMITDQYLGETAKNIDRTFYLSKRLSPCILFIDEFDFVAKNRSSDENAALKRAVNTLLKAIDNISLVKDGVLLIAATNHPQLLDHAVWRRFDEIVEFKLPDLDMRREIFEILLRKIEGEIDTEELAELTEDYSGSDLRVVLRDAVLSALLKERTVLTQDDILKAIHSFENRMNLKTREAVR